MSCMSFFIELMLFIFLPCNKNHVLQYQYRPVATQNGNLIDNDQLEEVIYHDNLTKNADDDDDDEEVTDYIMFIFRPQT